MERIKKTKSCNQLSVINYRQEFEIALAKVERIEGSCYRGFFTAIYDTVSG